MNETSERERDVDEPTWVVDPKVYNSSSSWWFEGVCLGPDGERLKVTVRANAYEFQSFGRVERWDGAKWQLVSHLPGELLTNGTSYVSSTVADGAFDDDVTRLLVEAFAVVGR